MASRGASAKNKGNSYELKIVKEFKELGWEEAKTSRLVSKLHDNLGIDIMFTDPFSIQCKAIESAIQHINILENMPKDEKINCVFHKRDRKEVVILFKKDFYKLLTLLKGVLKDGKKPKN